MKCPLCGGVMVRTIQDGNATLWECDDCGHYETEYTFRDVPWN